MVDMHKTKSNSFAHTETFTTCIMSSVKKNTQAVYGWVAKKENGLLGDVGKVHIYCSMCDTMLGIRCVGECQSEDPFVCFGAKPTQRACA